MSLVPGADDNSANDVAAWYGDGPTWLLMATERTSGQLVIDHSGNVDGPRPSGSHKKREAVQQHFWLRMTDGNEFSRDHEDGKALLYSMKDRSGFLYVGKNKHVAELHTIKGGSFYLSPPVEKVRKVKKIQPDGTEIEEIELIVDVDDQALGYSEADLELLAERLEMSLREGCGITALTGDGGGADGPRRALEHLFKEGLAKRRRDPGSNGVMRFWMTEYAPEDAYTDAEEAAQGLNRGLTIGGRTPKKPKPKQ